MRAHLALPLLASLIAIGSGAAIAALGPRERANQLGALVMASIALWAGCEVLWSAASDARAALVWHRIAAPGFVYLGAHAISFTGHLQRRGLSRLQRAGPFLYAAFTPFVVLCWFGDSMLAGMERTPWGWSLVPGPLLPVWLGLTLATVAFGLVEWIRSKRSDGAWAVRVGIWVTVTAVAASSTDVILASFGLQVPRVGSLAVSTAGVAILVALSRLDYSRLNAAGLSQGMLRILPSGVALVRPSGRIQVANPRLEELLDAQEGGAEGRLLSDHLALPVLEPGAEYRAEHCELVQASGRRIPVAVSTARVLSARGTLRGVVLVVADLREVEALRTSLMTSGRLAVVGQLASGIAHELNNPLSFVRSNLHHLARECAALGDEPKADLRSLAGELEEVVHESLEGVERALRIVSDVNAFSHAGGEAQRPVELNEIVDQALSAAMLGLASGVQVERFAQQLPEIHGSPQRLKQLFLNLLINAVRAVGAAGQVCVETWSQGDHVCAAVSDDGCGIAPDALGRIFDPFFTTREAGDGTGLGLAVCHEIVRSHGAAIEVISQPGYGTRVELRFPAWTRDGVQQTN
jgi:signal transduction histidine kinase